MPQIHPAAAYPLQTRPVQESVKNSGSLLNLTSLIVDKATKVQSNLTVYRHFAPLVVLQIKIRDILGKARENLAKSLIL